MPRSCLPLLILLAAAAAAAGPAVAGDAVHEDELMVVTRSVMPRVAYRGLEPTANPVRVQATVFPGRVFHGAMDAVVGRLAGDEELGERAPMAAAALPAMRIEAGAAGPLGASAQGTGTAPRMATGAIGAGVVRATSNIGGRVGQAVLRATGGGP